LSVVLAVCDWRHGLHGVAGAAAASENADQDRQDDQTADAGGNRNNDVLVCFNPAFFTFAAAIAAASTVTARGAVEKVLLVGSASLAH
jgi:hypothetical protein